MYYHILGENSYKRGKMQKFDIKHLTCTTVPSLDQCPGNSQEELGQGAIFILYVLYLWGLQEKRWQRVSWQLFLTPAYLECVIKEWCLFYLFFIKDLATYIKFSFSIEFEDNVWLFFFCVCGNECNLLVRTVFPTSRDMFHLLSLKMPILPGEPLSYLEGLTHCHLKGFSDLFTSLLRNISSVLGEAKNGLNPNCLFSQSWNNSQFTQYSVIKSSWL